MTINNKKTFCLQALSSRLYDIISVCIFLIQSKSYHIASNPGDDEDHYIQIAIQ